MGCEPDVPCSAGALDQGMYDFCKEKGVPTMLLKGNTVLKNRGQSFIKAGDGSFKKMGTVKTKFIQDLLELGIAPILTDADVVWLKDPRDYFNKAGNVEQRSHVYTCHSFIRCCCSSEEAALRSRCVYTRRGACFIIRGFRLRHFGGT